MSIKSVRCLLHAVAAILCLAVAAVVQAATQPYVSGHDINFATGNKYLAVTDVKLTGPVGSLAFTRTYNSQDHTSSLLGYGWTTTLTERLIIEASAITLVEEGGRHVIFKSDGSGAWTNETGKKRVISATASGYQLQEPSGTVSSYDGAGLLQTIRDRNGNTRSYIYLRDQLSAMADEFGHSLAFGYTEGKLTSLTCSLGTWTYAYENDNLVTVTRPDGGAIRYLYEDAADVHNLTGVVDESGARVLTVGYDAQDRVIRSAKAGGSEEVTLAYPTTAKREITNSLGVKTTYALEVLQGVAVVGAVSGPGCTSCGGSADSVYRYNERAQVLEATDAHGVKTTYSYDAAGNRTQTVKAAGTPLAQTVTRTYDPATNQVATLRRASLSALGQEAVTTSTYDARGNLLTRQEEGYAGVIPISRTTRFTSNSVGQVTAIDGPRSDSDDTLSLTYYANDAGQGVNRGHLHTVTDALGHTITYSDYNAFGQAERIVDANGIVTTRGYDGQGRLLGTTTAGLTTTYAYSPSGELQTVTLPGGRVISYSYNSAGRLERVSDSLGNAISFTYDSEGRKAAEEIRDPQGALTRYAGYGYDDYGRLTGVTWPDGAEETSAYDLVGNLMSDINALAVRSDYQYDALRRLLAGRKAGTTEASYTYDANDNLSTVTDARGLVTNFTYDDFGRRLTKNSPDTGTTTYAYDQAGNLISAIDAKGQQTSFAYDGLNRRIRQSIAGGADIVASYDSGPGAIGRISGITDGEGTASFAYDQSGRLALESRVTAGRQHSIAYTWDNSSGDLLAITYPSGLTLSLTRDAAGRVTDMRLGNEVLLSAATYLPFGPLKTATLGSVNLTRHYDQRYNLAMIEGGGLRHQYTRNALGNVIALADLATPPVDDAATDYTYNTANNQLTATAGTKAVVYIYDANGNLVSAGGRVFVYDGANRLVKVEDHGTVVATYSYDSSNRRIRKTVGSTTTCYLYDINSQLIAESADGTVVREYFYLDGQPLALREYQSNPGTYFFINDHLGTPQRLVSGSGTLVWQAIYSPFGKAERVTGSVQNNLRFPGQYFDAETGLHYNWHRYYDPDAGRYVSADPVGLDGGMNQYAYVEGNPVNSVDHLGLFGDGIWDGGGSDLGHSDFWGHDRFDYTAEDRGWSRPENLLSTWRHFRDLPDVESDLSSALMNCDVNSFSNLMHQGQDYFSHTSNGYTAYWGLNPLKPKTWGWGHLWGGTTPDKDQKAWHKGNRQITPICSNSKGHVPLCRKPKRRHVWNNEPTGSSISMNGSDPA